MSNIVPMKIFQDSKAGFTVLVLFSIFFLSETWILAADNNRPRARDLGIQIGVLRPGKWNAITDVGGVKVGQVTLIERENIRTGVTAIVPHGGNLFRLKVPAAIYVGNGFGKLCGFTQVEELGNIETPILLTNTLNVPKVADALIDYMIQLKGNEHIRSINPIVGETNDGWLNEIQGRHVTREDVFEAINNAKSGPVEEGSVGAGTGTMCLGFKGGIGTSSRILPEDYGGYRVGVLVQTNYRGILEINGAPVGRELGKYYLANKIDYPDEDGSCMIVVATDAPVASRNLKRLAKRAFLALAKTGSFSSNGSGDYVIAFSTYSTNLIQHEDNKSARNVTLLSNDQLSPLFLAVVEATQEAVYNSLFRATTVIGRDGHKCEAIPIDKVMEICRKYNVLNWDKTLSSN
ncbi:MAG: P1 family peptidase [bacterium]